MTESHMPPQGSHPSEAEGDIIRGDPYLVAEGSTPRAPVIDLGVASPGPTGTEPVSAASEHEDPVDDADMSRRAFLATAMGLPLADGLVDDAAAESDQPDGRVQDGDG